MWFRRKAFPKPGANPPFTAVTRRTKAKSNGSHLPLAEVSFDRGLLSSGLLARLSGTDAKTLLAILSTVTANGRVCAPTVLVARALGVPAFVAKARLVALSLRTWRGRPVVYRVGDGASTGYSLSPEIVGQRLGPLEREDDPERVIVAAGRHAVVEHARQRYSKPKDEVEAELAAAYGWVLPEEIEAARATVKEPEPTLERDERHAKERLIKHGVEPLVADDLVRRYGRDRVARQIAYLSFRKAKTPAKVLVSAIAGDWEPPPGCPVDFRAGGEDNAMSEAVSLAKS